MVARSPPPSLRGDWLQLEFSLAGQACHWSLNGLPWQITLHSCPPTVEIKLCPVSASFVFSSLCLFLCLSSLPLPPFLCPLSSNSLNCGGLSKVHSDKRLSGGKGWFWVIMLGKRDEWLNSFGASLAKKKKKKAWQASPFTLKSVKVLSSTNRRWLPHTASICIHTSVYTHT